MTILFTLGRVLLVLFFIVSGSVKLLDIAGTAAMIAPAVTVPDALADAVNQLQTITGMKVPQLLAIFIGAVEVVAGLLVAFNIATRSAAFVLAIFMLVATYYSQAFWTMSGPALQEGLIQALKNLSIVGGLLAFVVLGSWRPLPSNN